jgi:hypothetical protein
VISKLLLDPDAPPIAKAHEFSPEQESFRRKQRPRVAAVQAKTNRASSNSFNLTGTTASKDRSQTTAVRQGDATQSQVRPPSRSGQQLWEYVKNCVEGTQVSPEHPVIQGLLRLTQVRELRPKGPLKTATGFSGDRLKICSMLVYMTGKANDPGCSLCLSGDGLFLDCVTPAAETDQQTLKGLSTHVGTCASCMIKAPNGCNREALGSRVPVQTASSRPRVSSSSTSSIPERTNIPTKINTPTRAEVALRRLEETPSSPEPSYGPFKRSYLDLPTDLIRHVDGDATWKFILEQFTEPQCALSATALGWLLKVPRVRELRLNTASDIRWPISDPEMSQLRHVASMLMYLTGDVVLSPCTNCRHDGDKSPFKDCVLWSQRNGKGNTTYGSGACANCQFKRSAGTCSIRNMHGPRRLFLVGRLPPDQIEDSWVTKDGEDEVPGRDAPEPKSQRASILSGRRASEKKSQLDTASKPTGRPKPSSSRNASGKDRDESDTTDAPASELPSLPPRSVRSISSEDQRSRTTSVAREKRATVPTSSSDPWNPKPKRGSRLSAPMTPAQNAVLEQAIEEIENRGVDDSIQPGSTGPRAGASALPATHLADNPPVQLQEGIEFLQKVMSSGMTLRLEALPEKTRLCSLVSGKIQVRIGDEPEFDLGAGGIFIIAPGKTCSLLNRTYMDAVLTVTAIGQQ